MDILKRLKPRGRGPISFEQQLLKLANCGITLAPGVVADSLLESYGRESFEADPYRLLLACMGGEAESESQAAETGHPSDNIWHFDTECIEDHGDYARIARRMRRLAQGELPIEDIADHVDVDAGEAHLTFRLRGEPYRWDAAVEDDWVDATILSRFAALLERVGKSRRFTCIDLGGQDCLIGCATAEEQARLVKETGLKVEWLR